MTFNGLALASIRHYRRPHVAVVLGIAGAVTVLAGSLLVGASVRNSLRDIATSRLGRTAVVATAEYPFTEQLSDRVARATTARVAPLLALTGVVRHEPSSRRAGNVSVYGVDARFFAFHGVSAAAPPASGVLLSPDLAAEIGAASGDTLVLRVPRVTDIPIDSLHGRKDDVGRSIRLSAAGVLPGEAMGEFSLSPGQGPVRAVFVALVRLQRDLGLNGRVNTLLIGGDSTLSVPDLRAAVAAAATIEDLGLRLETLPDAGTVVVESASGLIDSQLARKISQAAAAAKRSTTPVLTWLANRLSVDSRTVPYSLVTAVGDDAAGDPRLAALLRGAPGEPPPIVLNEWTARDLGAVPGRTLELEYFRWADEGRLVTERTSFRIAGVIPMTGLAVDRRLAPDYPGITSAANFSDWDPPFPLDLGLIRKQDEDYWDEHRTAPKAFIRLDTGQSLWRTRHGDITSIRVGGPDRLVLEGLADGAGPIRVVGVRAQNLAASAGATDFGAYFSYFSFFLMVSALLLAALFFRLAVEQRLPQIGVLRAAGFSVSAVRRVLVVEGSIVTAAGALIGVLMAIAWAKLMVLALTTWWIGAVGTTRLALHIDPVSLGAGALSAAAAALLSLAVSVRTLSRTSPRAQIAGNLPPPATSALSRSRARTLALLALGAGGLLSGAGAAGLVPAAGAFFAGGALVLVGGLAAFRLWLAGPRRGRAAGTLRSITGLGLRNAAWRPGRSLTAAGLVASAVFLIVAVDSFRKTATRSQGANSGTGGFALLAETEVPIVHDLSTAEGRREAGVTLPDGVTIQPLRLRPGDDTSCLNLFQPKQPRVLGVPDRLIRENRFRFAGIIGTASDDARKNPWTLLGPPDADGRVPAIVDQTSLQYVLHAGVGDVVTIDADSSRPIDLVIVASLDDTVLQGEIMIGDQAFRQLFPGSGGYRSFLIGAGQDSTAPASAMDVLAGELEESLQSFGFDAQSAHARLEAFHRVENTYLSTFQALGGLGLVLGCLGLVAVISRNVFDRRRELALLGAAGYTGRDLQRLVTAEHLAVVGAGLLIGLAAAALAIAPVIALRSGAEPWRAAIWVLPVAAAGAGAAWAATRSLRRLPLLSSLRSE